MTPIPSAILGLALPCPIEGKKSEEEITTENGEKNGYS
jgi:hypothetical protein